MENSIIHIFEFGSTHFISLENSCTIKNEELTTLQTLIDSIWDLKSPEINSKKVYDVIHIFDKKSIRWQSNFNILIDVNTDSLKGLIDDLVAEMINIKNNNESTETPI